VRTFLAIVLASTTAAVFVQTVAAYTDYPQLDATLTHFVGRPATVRCDDPDGNYTSVVIGKGGQLVRPGSYIVLAPGVCENMLSALADPASYSDSVRAGATAEQFLLFAHEIGHMRGGKYWADESRQWCFGVSHVQAVMAYMGVSQDYIAKLWPYVLQQAKLWPALYRQEPCRIMASRPA
jgi:hypothetical protein